MASNYGANYLGIFQTYPSVKVDSTDWHGIIRQMYDTYQVAAALAIGDKIYLGRIPQGGRIMSATVAFPSLGATGVATLGYEYPNSEAAANTNFFMSSITLTSALTQTMAGTNNNQSFGYVTLGEMDIVMTVTTATDGTNGLIKCHMSYTID